MRCSLIGQRVRYRRAAAQVAAFAVSVYLALCKTSARVFDKPVIAMLEEIQQKLK